jgi:membrane associated rhomboid family serine protease
MMRRSLRQRQVGDNVFRFWRKYPGTATLMAILVAMFAIEIATGRLGDETALLALGALPNNGELAGQYWRVATYALLHLSWTHLILNGALLWWTGRIVERRVGTARMLATFWIGALTAGVVTWIVRSQHPKSDSVIGASAGIFALLAVALVLVYRRDAAGFGQDRGLRLGLWACLAVGVGISFMPGVSLIGHLGGLLPGLALGAFLPVQPLAARTSSA